MKGKSNFRKIYVFTSIFKLLNTFLTDALFCWWIAHFYTFSIIVAVFTRIIWDWDTVSVIDTFVSLFTFRNGTFILDFTSAFNPMVSSRADTVTDLG